MFRFSFSRKIEAVQMFEGFLNATLFEKNSSKCEEFFVSLLNLCLTNNIPQKRIEDCIVGVKDNSTTTLLLTCGPVLLLALADSTGTALASAEISSTSTSLLPFLDLPFEPQNALSLPTWTIHVASVVEWYFFCKFQYEAVSIHGLLIGVLVLFENFSVFLIFLSLLRIVAISLVWQYGGRKGRESWRGLAWGMLPLLVGAMCACTWHFFYNSPKLEVN